MSDTMRIDSIIVGSRFRKDIGDIDSLARSISEMGLLQPIVLDKHGRLIAGYRRLMAAKKLGWEHVQTVTTENINTALLLLKAERDENTCRKDLSISEAVAISEMLEPLERKKSQDQQKEHGNTAPGRQSNIPVKIVESSFATEQKSVQHNTKNTPVNLTEVFEKPKQPQSLDRVASAVGMVRTTLVKAKAVVEAARQEPIKYAPLVTQMDKTGKVNGAYKKLVVLKQAEELKKEAVAFPTGKYRVLVIDPPWMYGRTDDITHRSSNPYPSMTIDEIKKLPVPAIIHNDAIIWLWTTNAYILEAFEIIKHWGFEYKTMLTWAKDRIGTGDWLRGQTEHCLLCIKGKPTIVLTNQSTLLLAPSRDHSRKPDEFYTMVEKLCPGSKVELFARQTREGWINYGDQAK